MEEVVRRFREVPQALRRARTLRDEGDTAEVLAEAEDEVDEGPARPAGVRAIGVESEVREALP
jgi:hypothetical protein